MKRSLVISFLIILFLSCAVTEEVSEVRAEKNKIQNEISDDAQLKLQKLNYAKDYFYPPEWIWGTWSDGSEFLIYKFVEKDVLSIVLDRPSSFKDTYSRDMVLDVVSTGDKYEFTVKVTSFEQTYRFEKVSATKLHYTLITNGEPIGPIELVKE